MMLRAFLVRPPLGRPGTSRALSVAPKNTHFGQQFGFQDDPWPLVIRAAQHRADGYLLTAHG